MDTNIKDNKNLTQSHHHTEYFDGELNQFILANFSIAVVIDQVDELLQIRLLKLHITTHVIIHHLHEAFDLSRL